MRTKLLLLGPLAAALLVACPDTTTGGTDGGPPDGSNLECLGDQDCGDSEVCNLATAECEAAPTGCQSDYECEAGQRCNEATGDCETGTYCNPTYGNAQCNSDSNGKADLGSGCGQDDSYDCVCDPADTTCKDRRLTCETCTRSVECGDDYGSFREHTAECVTYGGADYCLQRAGAEMCPPGYKVGQVPGQDGNWCVPETNDCATAYACTVDADCPEDRPNCNPATGLCGPACSFDIMKGDSSCANGKVCDYDGRCRNECDPANDTCGDVNPAFSCVEDTGGVHRCRPSGCIDDKECETPGDESGYAGFCELSTYTCEYDRCRKDKDEDPDDPNNFANPDCKSSYKCTEAGVCEQMTCVERGGVSIACGAGDFCCGECRNVKGTPSRDACDPVVCDGTEAPSNLSGALEGCVKAPTPPWCQGCGSPADCVGFENPKEHRVDTNLCVAPGVCAPTCETSKDCPSAWQCSYLDVVVGDDSEGVCGAGTPVDEGPWGDACDPANSACQDSVCAQDPTDEAWKCHIPVWKCDCGTDAGESGGAGLCPEVQGKPSRCVDRAWKKFRCVVSKVCVPQGGACPEG